MGDVRECPFCGETDIASVPAELFPGYESDYEVVAQCMCCGAKGPDRGSKSADDAFAKWDGRSYDTEIARKEEVIQKFQRGQVRRDEMADMINRLVLDRDHWRSMAKKGSKSTTRKLNEYRERAIKAETALEQARALSGDR